MESLAEAMKPVIEKLKEMGYDIKQPERVQEAEKDQDEAQKTEIE
jgi:UDP-N-acetylglucosamine enolpyruvyl transferase